MPSEKLEEETWTLCVKIIKSPPLVQWIGKRIMRRALDTDLEAILELGAHSAGLITGSEDSAEAARAFREKRSPVFKGR